MTADERFSELQTRLRDERVDLADPRAGPAVIGIPSIDLEKPIRQPYDTASFEERWIFLAGLLRRPETRVALVTSDHVAPRTVEHQLSLLPDPAGARQRLTLVGLGDLSDRPLAAKVLERPDALARLRAFAADTGAWILPFNVRELERDLALAIGAPVFGVDHRFAFAGTKTGSRRVFSEAGVALPAGSEGLHDAAGVADAVRRLRAQRPGLRGAMVKLDHGVFGEGNAVLSLAGLPPSGDPDEPGAVRARVAALPDHIRDGLADGAAVEELLARVRRSPSAQVLMLPSGAVRVVATHEQILGGATGHQYVGCRYPADRVYRAELTAAATRIGRALARRGVVGRAAIDFVAAPGRGGWELHAVEINPREGGTTHPFGTLALLTDGERHMVATDRVRRDEYADVEPGRLLDAAEAARLTFDPDAQTGVVFHMLRALPREGRVGIVAIGRTAKHAGALERRARGLLDELAPISDRRTAGSRR